jgi:3-dehydroquinate synthetase
MPQIILKDALALDSVNETALSRGMNEVAKLAMNPNANASN